MKSALPLDDLRRMADDAGGIRKSQDENFHVCVGIATTSKGPVGFVRCLYLPEYGA